MDDQPLDISELKRLVKERRSGDGLSLRAAAAEAGVPFNTLARVERGDLPDLTNFRRIVNWLGIEPERFFRPSRQALESTPDVIAHHLHSDTSLSAGAADQIAGLVRQLYENLAMREIKTKVHLRAASTFVPDGARLLGELLDEMQAGLTKLPPK